MSERTTTVKRARRASRGRATPKGGRFKTDTRTPQEQAFERAQRAAKRSRSLLRGEVEPQGARGKKARRKAGKRQRQARRLARR